MRTNTRPRGSPRIRLISSLAMLVLVIGGVSFYSVRKTGDLFAIGVNDHIRCAIETTSSRQDGLGQFASMLPPVLEAAGADYVVASAHRCNVDGRSFVHIILRRDRTLASLILTPRGEQEVFPRALSGRVVHASGIPLHEGSRGGYSVAAFESGAYLGYIVSAPQDRQGNDLPARVAPVMERYIRP